MYRDDHAWHAPYAQHVGIAMALLEQFESLPQRLAGGMTDDELELLRAEGRMCWEGLWDQLAQARRALAARGRDLGGYDRARAAAGDIYGNCVAFAVSPWAGRTRRVTFVSAPTAPAVAAIRALLDAAPEVVVARAAPLAVDLRPRRLWPLLLILALVGGWFALLAHASHVAR